MAMPITTDGYRGPFPEGEVAGRILKTRNPNFPQFFFEWHPQMKGKVYRIDVPGEWHEGVFHPDLTSIRANGVCVAEHCEHHARFLGFVQTYLRGYLKGLEDAKEINHA